MNIRSQGEQRSQDDITICFGRLPESGNRLWNPCRNRWLIDTLSGTLVRIERIVGALEEFRRRFASLVIRESAREMATDFLSLVFQFKAAHAGENVANFVCAAFG